MGGSLLHVHAAQQRRRGRLGTAQFPTALVADPVRFLHQPLTRGHRLAYLALCCYSPGWLWEETQLLSVRRGSWAEWDRDTEVNGRKRADLMEWLNISTWLAGSVPKDWWQYKSKKIVFFNVIRINVPNIIDFFFKPT